MFLPISLGMDVDMDGRREPRFQIYAPAKLTLIDSPEKELDCLLLDVSATGLKFVVNEDLPPDEIVALEVENHLVLADVRYSQARGEKFAIGAERIHGVDKAALVEYKTKAEQIRFVVDDYRSRIRMAIAEEHAPVKKQEEGLPILHRDQVVEAAVQKLAEQWAKESEKSPTDGTLRAAIVEPAANVERATGAALASQPVAARTPAQPLMAAQPTRPGRASWRLPFVAAGAIAMMAFTGSLFWSYRHSVAANSTPAAIRAGTHIDEPAIPVTISRTRRAEIHVLEPVWVYVLSDGKELFGKLLGKDETRQIEFVDQALIRVGNAGGVEISVDGKSVGPLGQRGQIRAIEITADGHRFVPLSAVPEKN